MRIFRAQTKPSRPWPTCPKTRGGVKRGWYLDGDDWYFRKGNGKLRKDEYWYMEREKTWYGFDEDGRMYENQLVRDPKLDSILEGDSTEGEITPAYYVPVTDGIMWTRVSLPTIVWAGL